MGVGSEQFGWEFSSLTSSAIDVLRYQTGGTISVASTSSRKQWHECESLLPTKVGEICRRWRRAMDRWMFARKKFLASRTLLHVSVSEDIVATWKWNGWAEMSHSWRIASCREVERRAAAAGETRWLARALCYILATSKVSHQASAIATVIILAGLWMKLLSAECSARVAFLSSYWDTSCAGVYCSERLMETGI